MALKIKRYEAGDEAALFGLMRSEGEEWGDYTRDAGAVSKYKTALGNSTVYVGYDGGTLCGFIRAKDDDGYGVYIYDLLVHKDYRGNGYGRLMMERVCADFEGSTVYVMSDIIEEAYQKTTHYNMLRIIAKQNNPSAKNSRRIVFIMLLAKYLYSALRLLTNKRRFAIILLTYEFKNKTI